MTMIQIELPDEVALRAKSAGLLSGSAIQVLLEDAMRRRAGRALLGVARDIQGASIPPMSMEEIDAEVKAFRADRRASKSGAQSPGSEPGDDAGRI
jgi:hypothetical protein